MLLYPDRSGYAPNPRIEEGPQDGDAVALLFGLCRSMVFRAFRKSGLTGPASLEHKPQFSGMSGIARDMLHVDIMRLGKVVGWGVGQPRPAR